MDMKKLMAEAQKMQQELSTKMKEFDEKLFSFNYKNLVNVEIYGNLKIKSLTIINDEIIDKNDKETLQDIITSCINNAIEALIKGKTELTSKIAGPGLSGLM